MISFYTWLPASLKVPAECNIGLKDFPDGILSDRKENPIKVIMGDHVTFKLEVQDVSFQTQILPVTLKAVTVTVKSGDTGEAFVKDIQQLILKAQKSQQQAVSEVVFQETSTQCTQ